MESKTLGLPIFYQEYPQYFDSPSHANYAHKKNQAVEKLLHSRKTKYVLDITCGTGSQVLYLAALGYSVTGSDFSPELVKIAKRKAAQQNLSVQLFEADMRTAQLGTFEAVIAIDNVIGHLYPKDFEIALDNISNNLQKDGIFIFDILNLEAMTDEVIQSDNNKMTHTRTTEDGTIITNVRHGTIDRNRGLLKAENYFTFASQQKIKKINNQYALQIYTIAQLHSLLASHGFQILEQFKIDAYTFEKDDTGYSIMTVAKRN